MPREAHVYLIAGKSTGNFNNGERWHAHPTQSCSNKSSRGELCVKGRAVIARWISRKSQSKSIESEIDFRAFHCALIYRASSMLIRRRFPFFYLYFRIKGARWWTDSGLPVIPFRATPSFRAHPPNASSR